MTCRLLTCCLLVLIVCLAGCAPSDPPVETVTESDPAPTASAADPSEAAAPAAPVLSLDSEGLRVVAPSGSTQLLAFGAALDDVVETVSTVRGERAERSQMTECGAGPLDSAMWPGGLTAYGQGGQFAGWAVGSYGAPSDHVTTTMTGLGIGSTRAKLDSAYDAVVQESTLGTEFSAGDLYGVLSGPSPDATVDAMWAGVSCNFR